MSTSEPTRIYGELKIAFNYTCRKCGREMRGSSRSVAIDVAMPSQVQEPLELERGGANEMPVGWASFYGPHENEYLCEECILKGVKL